MRIKRPAGVYKALLYLVPILLSGQVFAAAVNLRKNAQGMIQPFRLNGDPLSDFVRDYARITGTKIQTAGPLEDELKGSVTLFIHRPISEDTLTELFHQLLKDHGYSVVDAPSNAGWIVLKSKDARDASVPIYDSKDFPNTYRLITVVHPMKHVSAEYAARVLRSFMPANSRIIPVTPSQLAITDSGRNIRKSVKIIELMDTKAASKLSKEIAAERMHQRACPSQETKIANLVVEKLEIREPHSFNPPQIPAPTGVKR